MFQIPFYQTTWNNVDLNEIVRDIGLKQNALPTDAFYKSYYERLNQNPELVSDQWKNGKKHYSEWLEKQLNAYGGKTIQSISIGAGLGLIEKPLIEKGFQIDLHDFQSSSFDHLSMNDLTTCYAGDWSNLPAAHYDVCFTMATTYAFSDETLTYFAKQADRILKPGGVCIVIDTSLSWWEIYAHIRNHKRYAREQVLWGYKRSIAQWQKAFPQFETMARKYYEKGVKEMTVKTILGVPYGETPHRQMVVFKKKK